MILFNKKSGQAILLVITILGAVSVIGLSFLYMNRVQLRGAITYMARLQTRYLAEAGINRAKAILKFDKQMNDIDSYDELWRTAFS
ncbi:hypothetical protein HQ550_02575, partial [bacterium]|nr:hypothetical protein [bacterium]